MDFRPMRPNIAEGDELEFILAFRAMGQFELKVDLLAISARAGDIAVDEDIRLDHFDVEGWVNVGDPV